MKFVHSTGWDEGIAALTERLVKLLHQQKRVLWLVSGGSNISATVQIMATLPAAATSNLTIMLADERYGKVGHKDSNWKQLVDAGLEAKNAKLIPTLHDDLSLDQTVAKYEGSLLASTAASDIVIAQLGIGTDGHIAGILPGSPAASEPSRAIVGYATDEFQRITISASYFKNIDAAYAFAFGNTKHRAIEDLIDKKSSITKQPAQLLHKLGEAYLYTDQVGENV